MAKIVDPVTELQRYRKGFTTQKAAAADLGISAVYFGDLLNRRRDCPEWLLTRFGLKRVVIKAES